MDKINFEDLPSTNTPLNADNLNKMQSNIEKSVVAVGKNQPTSENVWFKKGKNLANIPFTQDNKKTITATYDDFYETTDYSVYLTAGKTYTLSFESDGTAGSSAGTDTVQIFLLLDKGFSELFFTRDSKTLTFTVNTSGNYYFRFDVNKNECTHSFWNIQIEQNLTATDYEPYIEKEIYVKNDNGVFEKFINADDIPQETDEVLLGNGTYYKKYGKVVSVYGQSRGGVTLTSDYLELGILPEGARPSRQILGIWTTIGINTSGLVVIETNGIVKIFGGTTNSSYWGFNITFIVD